MPRPDRIRLPLPASFGPRGGFLFLLALVLLASLQAGCASLRSEASYRALIRRTEGGIPHIRAADLASLGFGTLYAMSEDDVCILADQYITLGAERSRHHGPGEGNLESDFFYQLFIDRGDAELALPAELEALFQGAAAGYNHYLDETGIDALPDPRCRGASWIRKARPIDTKRVSRVDYALAYMMPIIVAASPPSASEDGANATPLPTEERVASVADYLEKPKEGGSNGVAIGRSASASGGGMLLANPHMPWNEPFQRFYPMHQTIPGELDVLGANLIGRPRVGFGHTRDVAWTSTVSTAKRITFYRLELDPEDPTRYLVDGVAHPMNRHVVTVQASNDAGELEPRTHAFYSTEDGALLVESPFFGWTREHAFAVRMPDVEWRGETSIRDQYAAKNVRELKAVHDRDQFLPVNLVAADSSGEVLYADPGPIPNLPDALVEECAVLGGAAYDGSRSACAWQDDEDAVAPGIFGPSKLPFLFRDDYVTNSNDSYWLANPAAPLEGFPRTLGGESLERTLRTRSGLEMVRRATKDGRRMTLDGLQALAFANENYAAEILRDDVIAFCRAEPRVEIEEGRGVDLTEACDVLAEWNARADLDSRGAALFREFLRLANDSKYQRRLPESFEPDVPFDAARPVTTPRGLSAKNAPAVRELLARAILRLDEAGIPLDAQLGDLQSVTRNGDRIPIHGGPEFEGVFNKIEADFQGSAAYPDVTRWSSSWVLAVDFGKTGPRTRGLLIYSLSSNPESPHFADQTKMYSRKEWLELPFREEDVAAAAKRAYEVVGRRSDEAVD